eukprot:m.891465 g.891465  ORF g.891465 m.891465 type:complete len:107 (+) comp23653_c0_seq8:300-620(+)
MGKQATTKEVQDAMNDPKDIKEATCLQFFMVILRAILYFMAFIGSMMAVVAYEVWRGKIKSKRQGFEGKVNPFNWFLWLLVRILFRTRLTELIGIATCTAVFIRVF